MINIQTLGPDDKTVRTQITLTEKLKALVEKDALAKGESLSEYLRKAAIERLKSEEDDKKSREKLANEVIGSIDLKNHPVWKTKKGIYKWVRKLREEESLSNS